MIEVIIAMLCFFFLIGVCLLKVYNLLSWGKAVEPKFVLLTQAAVVFLWLLYLVSFMSSVGYVETVSDGITTYEVESNEYLALANYAWFAHLIFLFSWVVTVGEVLVGLPRAVEPKMARPESDYFSPRGR